MRVRNKIKPEEAGEQCGFVEGKGTSNVTYTHRSLIERAVEVQKEVYLCFIDYTKAFDSATWWDNPTSNTVKERWKRPTSD